MNKYTIYIKGNITKFAVISPDLNHKKIYESDSDCKTRSASEWYSAIAAYSLIRHNIHLLDGQQVTIATDSKYMYKHLTGENKRKDKTNREISFQLNPFKNFLRGRVEILFLLVSPMNNLARKEVYN